MTLDYDYIVIGSGFGGSVMTCRLAEKGYKVCLLERGREWKMHEFPRRPDEVRRNMFWNPRDQKFGLAEIRDNPESDVMTISASGLGGGSLLYANVLLKMPERFFKGWPQGVNRESLEPHYETVLSMMEAQPYPFETNPYYHNTPKTALLKKLAEEMNAPQFSLPPLAVRFEGQFPGHQTRNKHGALQSRCNKCGDCDIGCNIHAKNTLDLNYIYRARHLSKPLQPADVRTHAQVTRIEYRDDHYVVTYVIPEFPLQENHFTAKNVVLSAGSIGSTSLLLKMKKHGYLPRLNSWLGKKWSGNGDFISWIFNTEPTVDGTNGPVITGSIEYVFKDTADGSPQGMYIQEAGYPLGYAWFLSGRIPQFESLLGTARLAVKQIKKYLFKMLRWDGHDPVNAGFDFSRIIDRAEFTKRCLILLGMGRDKSDGEIILRDDDEAVIRWKMEGSQEHFDRLRNEMKRIAEKVDGFYMENPLTHLNKIITVHPLGGCPMGDSAENGLVNQWGEVFGYPGLYVVDGSIIPSATGPNPSLTIAALAERIAARIPAKIKAYETEYA